MTLETITGNLRDAYRQLQPGTMLHADELMNERRSNEELCSMSPNAADGAIYFLDGNNRNIPTLAVTREAQNPILQNIDAAFEEFVNQRPYYVPQADLERALAAPDTMQIALPELSLYLFKDGMCYFLVKTTPGGYEKMNAKDRKFAEHFFGQGNDFVKNMERIYDQNSYQRETRIWVVNPIVVWNLTEKGAFARASRVSRDNFNHIHLADFVSEFSGSVHNNPSYCRHPRDYDEVVCVRGVRREE
ncbi:MAG: hypothetical protein AABW53_01050 [Nanoarchaeota archaeon]